MAMKNGAFAMLDALWSSSANFTVTRQGRSFVVYRLAMQPLTTSIL
jgi:hypothetical protein